MPTTIHNTGITFPDSTIQTTAAAGGGVTSLNGQSGAITNTGFADIGSYAVFIPAINDIANGETVAGSNLRFNPTQNDFVESAGLSQVCLNFNSSTYNCGGTAPSGTWRRMGGAPIYRVFPSKGGTLYRWYSCLFVRIS